MGVGWDKKPARLLLFLIIMVKTYISLDKALRILVKVPGRGIVPIEFKWHIYPGSSYRCCCFVTKDKDLQKALEKHKYFNSKLRPSFFTNDVEDEVVEPVVEKVEEKVAEVVEQPKPKRVRRSKVIKE